MSASLRLQLSSQQQQQQQQQLDRRRQEELLEDDEPLSPPPQPLRRIDPGDTVLYRVGGARPGTPAVPQTAQYAFASFGAEARSTSVGMCCCAAAFSLPTAISHLLNVPAVCTPSPPLLTLRPSSALSSRDPQTREGAYVEALVELVDMSCQPPQYGITLVQQPPTAAANGGHLRFTEGPRLFARSAGPALASHAQRQQQLETRKRERQQLQYQQPPFRAHCPACRAPLSLSDARLLCSEAVASWEAERTRAWLRANDVIACPHPGCGALILRVRPQGPGIPPSPPKPPPGASPRAAQASLAAAHREAHRYRCSACTRDFCDTCLAAPYHVGLTCAQALAPDCFLCGGKVGERRLEELLPKAAEAAAGEGRGAGGYSGRAGQRRAGAGPSGSGVVAMEVGEGEEGGAGGGGGGGGRAAVEAAREAAAALVRRATKTELVGCLKRLEVDARWCLERRDLERVRAARNDTKVVPYMVPLVRPISLRPPKPLGPTRACSATHR